LFQKHSSLPIDTKVIKLLVAPTQPENNRCLEVWTAEATGEKQKGFVEAAIKLKENMKGVPGLISSFGGITNTQVVTFLVWDKLESHQDFQKSSEFPGLLKDCVALAPKMDVYHVQL
jgi:heme-degrading monooxygenase HmoA